MPAAVRIPFMLGAGLLLADTGAGAVADGGALAGDAEMLPDRDTTIGAEMENDIIACTHCHC